MSTPIFHGYDLERVTVAEFAVNGVRPGEVLGARLVGDPVDDDVGV